ncbi:unnamed protein product [Moneuplotes crassus]|uniref:Transmembrane protein n=1 Tax=Euplotes crassus TaxID=5936 RepID=A0AAD1XYV9_EUPCR|nr:unnamed protein product [Moneuplotes crassus]
MISIAKLAPLPYLQTKTLSISLIFHPPRSLKYRLLTCISQESWQLPSSGTGYVTSNSNMEMSKGFYFSLLFGSVMEICRWEQINTNLDCFNFGVDSPTNFASISSELLFFGSIDTTGDQYYLVNYNFSASNLAWKKSITCPTPTCVVKFSNSLLSGDEKWIYTMVLYDNNFVFHQLSVADGTPKNSGLIWNDSGYHESYSMSEFSNFIAIQINSATLTNYQRLILVNFSDTTILKEYKSINSRSSSVRRSFSYKGLELMYHSGRFDGNDTSFVAKSPTNNIEMLQEFQEDTSLFSVITSNYQVSSTSANPSLNSGSQTLSISTSSSITTINVTSTTSPTFTTYVALWNEDHTESVQSNKLVQVNFTWACAQQGNYTAITFSLDQTGSNAIPEWIQLDGDKQELYLNTTPKLSEEQTFYFSLQISFNTDVYYKKFEISVEKCSIEHCDVCKLNNSSVCETCADGYQISDNQKNCSEVPGSSGSTTSTRVVTALLAGSIILASASSILSLSSPNSIFSIMNSMQLAVLLPLIPDYFSPKVLNFLSKMSFTMISFDFIKFKDIPFVEAITEWVSYPQSDGYLNSIGMRSGSSVVNYLSLMAIIILIGLIHLGIFLCDLKIENPKHRKCKKFFNNLFKFFTFNIYIRVFMQAFVFTTLSIFSELYNANLSTTVTKISFGFGIMFGICTSVLFILSFYMYCKSFPQIDQEKYWLCVEYFNGIKPKKYSKLYSSMFMLMRLLLTSCIIFGQPARTFDKATFFYLLNILYCIYLIIIRPFENLQDNIIEVTNQTLFCCLAVPLPWLNTKESWNPFYEDFYTTILITSPSICTLVCLIFLLKSLLTYILRHKSPHRQPTTPKPPSTPAQNPSPSSSLNPNSSNLSQSISPMDPAPRTKTQKNSKVRSKPL